MILARLAVLALAAAPPARAQAARPPVWSAEGGATYVSDGNLNRFFNDFTSISSRGRLSDTAWQWSGLLKFQPQIPRSVPLRFAYQYVDETFHQISAFDFRYEQLSVEATLPPLSRRLQPRLGGSFDWASDSQNLTTGHSRRAWAGLDALGPWGSLLRLDASVQDNRLQEEDRDSYQTALNLLWLKSVAGPVTAFVQLDSSENEARNADFSYHQSGAGGGLLVQPRPWLLCTLRYQAHFRRYFAPDSVLGFTRDDVQHDAFLTIRWTLTESLFYLTGTLEWQRNLSNASSKEYADLISSLGLQMKL